MAIKFIGPERVFVEATPHGLIVNPEVRLKRSTYYAVRFPGKDSRRNTIVSSNSLEAALYQRAIVGDIIRIQEASISDN